MTALIVAAAGILLLLTGAQCGPINGKQEQCDRVQMNTCFLSFLGELGIKDFPRNAAEVFTVIYKIISKEEFNGVKRTCIAARSFRDCFGSQYDSCVSEKKVGGNGSNETGRSTLCNGESDAQTSLCGCLGCCYSRKLRLHSQHVCVKLGLHQSVCHNGRGKN